MNTLSNTQKTIITILAILAVSFITLAIIGSTAEEPAPERNVNEQTTIEQEFKKGYMNGCTDGTPEMERYCECTYDHLTTYSTVPKLLEDAIEYEQTNKFTPAMNKALNYCLDTLE